ncbi:hypothetical protein [Halalkalibacter krulwichiae]|uniref:Uncharacterized protein n=1 Tax=Halalkalibacter krulwichiae TaxID=199441 RepID=A0A1X9MEU4_9BACI|nr:hypothetical protein [Halalkalibacter krulwichiae]ARK31958.1 hypothetical protein BkAM31D_20100 [Halalkalibacter krulwichiae]
MTGQFDKALDDLLWFSNKLIGTRTLFVSQIEETFKVIKVFNQNGCNLVEGVELPKDHVI